MKGTTLHSPYSDSNFDKPSQKTDLLVEQALKNLSDKEMSSLHDTKSSLNSLRSFSGVEQHVSDKKFSYEEVYRLEEEIKEKNNIIKELQANNNELAKLNIRLTKELELTIDKYEKISLKLQSTPRSKSFDIPKEVEKYAYFVSCKSKNTSNLKVFLEDRLEGRDLLDLLYSNKDQGLLVCLQVLSDIIVHNIEPPPVNLKPPASGIIQENEFLIHSISEHNNRMAKINRNLNHNSQVSESFKFKDVKPSSLL